MLIIPSDGTSNQDQPKEGHMLFKGVDRVLVLVNDMDKARAFFGDLLGVAFDRTIVDENVQIEVAMSRFGIELGMPLVENHPFITDREGFEKNGGFLSLIVVRVSDFDAAVAHLRERGIEPKAFLDIGGAREAIYDPADTFGLPIVLNEYPDSHGMTAQALGDETLSSRS